MPSAGLGACLILDSQPLLSGLRQITLVGKTSRANKHSQAVLQNRQTAFGEGRWKPHSTRMVPSKPGGDAMWQHTACVTPAKQRTRGTGGKEGDSHRSPKFLSSSPLQTLLCAPMGRAQLSQLWPLPTPTTAARTRRHHRAPPAHPHAVGEASVAPQDPPRPRRGISQCTLHGHRG